MTRLTSLLAFLSLATPAAAIEIAPPVNLCAIAAELAPEVTRLTGYPPATACPPIAFSLPASTDSGDSGLRRPAGAYDFDTRAIGLAVDLDMTEAYGRSILLHELVHAAQHRAGKVPACRAALEYEAYMAQSAYLHAQGAREEAIAALLFAGLLSSCEPSYD